MKFISHRKKVFHKAKRFNPHQYWNIFCVAFVIVLIAELCYYSWYFMVTTETLDAPVAAVLETNASKIKSMQQTLDTVEKALRDRAGVTIESSQNNTSVVQ
jgi:hypothetical protein